MSVKYTCLTCRVAFMDGDLQRRHYKTDWHRYNLKRKVIALPSVSAEEFQVKVLANRENEAKKNESQALYCKLCKKSFQSEKACNNHLNAKLHKDRLSRNNSLDGDSTSTNGIDEICVLEAKKIRAQSVQNDIVADNIMSDESDVEEVDSDEWDEDVSYNNPILHNNCLFCSNHSATITKNVKHMSVVHSFFIPDMEYIIDLKGLLLYLGEKICQGFTCIWCNDHGWSFQSLEAVRNHMEDKGHCKMLHEGVALLEYSNFYDYRTSYPDHALVNYDEEVEQNILDGNDYQLVLPSGATIGHRSLMRYYRQKFDPNKTVAPLKKKIHKVISQYRALGWKETNKQVAVRKAKDISFMRRIQSKHMVQIGVKANKLQKHFRPQVNF